MTPPALPPAPARARPPRRLSADNRREQIMRSAQQLFIERGFEGVSMADLSSQLQTSRATIYTYFPSTGAILDALFQEKLESIQAQLRPHVRAEQPKYPEILALLKREQETVQLLNSGGGPQFREQRQQILNVLRAWIITEIPAPLPDPQREWLLTLVMQMLLTASQEPALEQQWPTLQRFLEGGLQAVREQPTSRSPGEGRPGTT